MITLPELHDSSLGLQKATLLLFLQQAAALPLPYTFWHAEIRVRITMLDVRVR